MDEQQEPPKSKSGAPIGIIAGVAAVVIIGIGLGLAAFIYVRRRKSKPNLEEQVKPGMYSKLTTASMNLLVNRSWISTN